MSEGPKPHELLNLYIKYYLGKEKRRNDELEVRFGTNPYHALTKIDFDNIIEKIKSLGFTSDYTEGEYSLNISNEYDDPRSGKKKMGNIRTSIKSLPAIEKYCKDNTLTEETIFEQIYSQNVAFQQKFRKKVRLENDDGEEKEISLAPIDFRDFEFRVNYKSELQLTIENKGSFKVKNLLNDWSNQKKTFRLIKRYSYKTHNLPFRIDCSIVKTSKKRKYFIPEYTVEQSEVFKNPENYEIEIELLNDKARNYNEEELTIMLKNIIKVILSGWQQSSFPISFKEEKTIQTEYMKLIYDNKPLPKTKDGTKTRYIRSSDFIGPSSISLEVSNIIPIDGDSNIPNINNKYSVTEKADGLRKLLFVSKIGKIYLMDTNMNIQFTGMVTKHRNMYNSIIDGEHVLYNKAGEFINLYLAFDIYYKNKENHKGFPFIQMEGLKYMNDKLPKDKFRLNVLNKFIKELEPSCVVLDYDSPLKIQAKNFYTNLEEETNIFAQCKIILDGLSENMFEYETDGLIFTPCDKSVGSNNIGEIIPPKKVTWNHSMKWKPSEYNTVDFLISTVKDGGDNEEIGNIFKTGLNVSVNNQIVQYKTVILRVGFDENKHGFINPCADLIEGNFPKYNQINENNKYKPMPFIPTRYTPNFPIYECRLVLDNKGSTKNMLTESGEEVIEDNTIVEFRYDASRDKYFQWIPIRVRYDKTAEFRKGRRNYGNAFHVADSVWESINNPVTVEMITTGENIPDISDSEVYYKKITNRQDVRGLRDFHNRFVKRKLIMNVSSRGDTLMDTSVGKGGDLQKWIDSKLSLVFGVDLSKDNIENRINGACSRYLKAKKKYKVLPNAMFLQADSSKNIRNGEGLYSEKAKQIVNAILNNTGAREEGVLGKTPFKLYGKGKDGFNIISTQFSLHYFFENVTSLHAYLRNVSENCKVGGYLIGTCYDGKRIFRSLENKSLKESIFEMNNNDEGKMWDIRKDYVEDDLEDNDSCLGYKISVYMDTIGKRFTEYLVNFDYLNQVIENYGFVQAPLNDIKKMGFSKAIGSFGDLFTDMEEDIESNKIKKADVGDALLITSKEKRLSFFNNYFIYKKVHSVNASQEEIHYTAKQDVSITNEEEKSVEDDSPTPKQVRKVKKYKKKVKLPN
jgi:hypothetical protein